MFVSEINSWTSNNFIWIELICSVFFFSFRYFFYLDDLSYKKVVGVAMKETFSIETNIPFCQSIDTFGRFILYFNEDGIWSELYKYHSSLTFNIIWSNGSKKEIMCRLRAQAHLHIRTKRMDVWWKPFQFVIMAISFSC